MGRLARFIPGNSYFHVLSRGNNRQKVFFDVSDYENFIKILVFCKGRFSWRVIHYVLMSNHYHLIVYNETPKNLSDGVKMLNQSYVKYYRKKYQGCGHLWQDRFKSFVIEDGRYILECGRYIELNPINADIIERPEDYKYSSYSFYAFGKKNSLIDYNPEYLRLSDDFERRRFIYREFVQNGLKERRGIERYFRTGFYGSDEGKRKYDTLGLRSRNFKTGPRSPRSSSCQLRTVPNS